ncbi:MAG: aconitate hydratase [Actinobacteria bacterium]|nr:aconitate hydratase [Actinomycetota bacterium]
MADPKNSFGARSALDVDGRSFDVWRLDAVADAGDVAGLPYSLKILLENLLRHEDGVSVTSEDVTALARWEPTGRPPREIAFLPARVLMQDFTGVPAIVDLAAMRDAIVELARPASLVNPRVPVDLVIDHSVVADVAGTPDAFARNVELEYARNRERYAFLRWGQQAFDRFRVVPPGTGIVHQVNLEYLASVIVADDRGQAYPDTLVGTDSHTPMVNGLGVLGWGVGGIEAEAAMLGQPVSMLIPQVIGIRLTGSLPEGTTATDLVLTVTELLRRHGVVGRFVEFFGPGIASVALADRATIGNMAPEYGSTCAIFPIDDETLRYLRFTGRSPEQVGLVEAYAKAQGLFHDPRATPRYTDVLELDLSTVTASLAGPTRPQDRVPLDEAKTRFRRALGEIAPVGARPSPDQASAASFPASDPPAPMAAVTGAKEDDQPVAGPDRPRRVVPVTLAGRRQITLDHGHVVLAAITSCTNTSNPRVMLAAGLLARNAVEGGLETKPWVKTSLAPGSPVVIDYYERAGLTPYLEKLGFHLVGFGCTTCIGNSGPLVREISDAIHDADLATAAVLSGNRNFAGRIHPDVRMNYLASPPLVVAYALAGTMDVDLRTEPLGHDPDGRPVFLRDVWPTSDDITAALETALSSDMFAERYRDVFTGDDRWRGLPVPAGERYRWDPESTYVRCPPFLDDLGPEPAPLTDVTGARALAVLGDSVTTDHISPAGFIPPSSPAGRYLQDRGVAPRDFNSYGARRGNHEVMLRGTFANIRLRNRLVPGVEGGVTRHLPSGEVLSIYDAAMRYQQQRTPLVVLAGAEYGSGSSRDWAAKGTALLGVRSVIAESYERIHRSNLIGMGVVPLQFRPGESVDALGLTGHETFDVVGLAGGEMPSEVTVRADGRAFRVRVRIDTPLEGEYFRHGGILRSVLRRVTSR